MWKGQEESCLLTSAVSPSSPDPESKESNHNNEEHAFGSGAKDHSRQINWDAVYS